MDPQESINNRIALEPYKLAVKRYIRAMMMLKGVKYEDLSDALASRGIVIKAGNLRSKINKGMIATDLFIALIEILDVQQTAMVDILKLLDQSSENS
ncbi:hypothetical protein DBZ36_15845 [Alginatibacterium sediminis]|uniref:DUF6471 domain-containing protein n=1 Tax=Alginatibacterium sediminis TaxID=2164068 RepID=A0A420E938_9ALTE|nr:DUF6471 domain-containing protein [Alginatibacterium sediminis]RKF15843.1 hypothetical protein DBZ36_15845 [Alginatibacterium sediminis]